MFFSRPDCPSCDLLLGKLLNRINELAGIDIYLSGIEPSDDTAARDCASAHEIGPKWVRSRRITLNHDAGTLVNLTEGEGKVLYAVALTESGRSGIGRPWPWTLNVGGRGYFFDSRQAAWKALMKWLRAGRRSIDIGLMQVNWRYHKDRLGTPWQALDSYHNLRVGAAILRECFHARRDWWASVGC